MGCRKLFNPLHLEIVRLHWQRLSNVEISRPLGVHVNAVSKAINSEAAQARLSAAGDRVLKEMVESWHATVCALPRAGRA
jgi:hypothetical protein